MAVVVSKRLRLEVEIRGQRGFGYYEGVVFSKGLDRGVGVGGVCEEAISEL